jgi:hypothetical protein
MGEAQLVPTSLWLAPIGNPRTDASAPHIASRHIQFVTADVASVDAVIDNPAPSFENLPAPGGEWFPKIAAATGLVLIMVREEGTWRVATVRLTK